jgi:hypothetical protein
LAVYDPHAIEGWNSALARRRASVSLRFDQTVVLTGLDAQNIFSGFKVLLRIKGCNPICLRAANVFYRAWVAEMHNAGVFTCRQLNNVKDIDMHDANQALPIKGDSGSVIAVNNLVIADGSVANGASSAKAANTIALTDFSTWDWCHAVVGQGGVFVGVLEPIGHDWLPAFACMEAFLPQAAANQNPDALGRAHRASKNRACAGQKKLFAE